ncbi:hypothetical protein CRUP_026643 [Coryphaenoides rupestris]|nr:hypothetical protein CRUP_026643 [Coryphaenoides rupestris]
MTMVHRVTPGEDDDGPQSHTRRMTMVHRVTPGEDDDGVSMCLQSRTTPPTARYTQDREQRPAALIEGVHRPGRRITRENQDY